MPPRLIRAIKGLQRRSLGAVQGLGAQVRGSGTADGPAPLSTVREPVGVDVERTKGGEEGRGGERR